jgi:hypothetical protein
MHPAATIPYTEVRMVTPARTGQVYRPAAEL